MNADASTSDRIRAQIKPGSSATSIPNQASLSAQSPTDPTEIGRASRRERATITGVADPADNKNGPASALAGNYISYVLTVTNNRTSNATSETLTDALSGELQNATYCVDGASPPCDPSGGSS